MTDLCEISSELVDCYEVELIFSYLLKRVGDYIENIFEFLANKPAIFLQVIRIMVVKL